MIVEHGKFSTSYCVTFKQTDYLETISYMLFAIKKKSSYNNICDENNLN